MIYSIVGTNKVIRDKAYAELEKLGRASVHIYSEQIATLHPLIEARSLFGEKVIVNMIQVMDVAASRDIVIENLSAMEASENIFIIDEPFADANRIKRLEKVSKNVFNAKEEKERGADPFALCNAFGKRDKKTAWVEWMKIRDLEQPEAIHGALWWKMKTIWGDTLARKATKFTASECEDFSSKILKASLDAHRGKKDLKVEIESIILSL